MQGQFAPNDRSTNQAASSRAPSHYTHLRPLLLFLLPRSTTVSPARVCALYVTMHLCAIHVSERRLDAILEREQTHA